MSETPYPAPAANIEPMSEPIMVVAGLGRCGTSLVMQMLDAAGLPVVVGDGPPAYEDPTQLGLIRDSRDYAHASAWLTGLAGQFVKLLDPFRLKLPRARYSVLWLDRDYEEQAKSQLKFLHVLGLAPKPTAAAVRRIERQLPKDRQASFRQWRGLGVAPTILTFERLLRGGDAVAELAEWAGMPERASAMAEAIVPRFPACLPGLLEVDLPRSRPPGARQ